MKRFIFSVIATIGSLSISYAQTSTDSTQYNYGAIGVQQVAPVNINSQSSCADTLGISIPSGHWVSSIDVEYTINTTGGFGGSAPNDIGVYLELSSEGAKEAALDYGTIGTNGSTETITRTINDFNGAVTDTFLIFKLHAFRQQFATACGTTTASIADSSWKIIVNHYPAPTCYQPTDLSVDWTMSNKAKLSWTSGGAANWEVEYGTPGFTPGSGTRVAVSSNPFVLSGLSASTTYEFYVRDSCGLGDVSIWSAPVVDSTLCAPITFTTSYTEDFDGTGWSEGSGFDNDGSTIGSCWQRNPTSPNGGQGYAFGTGTDSTSTAGTGPNDDRTGGGNYVYAEASGAANQSVATITSPLIDLSALSTPELNFWYHMAGAQVNELKTEVWSQSSGWVNVGSINGPQQSSAADTFLLQTYTLAQFADDTVLVRFSASRGFGNNNQADIAIDDFGFEEAPTCPDPSLLAVYSRTTSSITLSWQAVNAASWDIQYGSPSANLGATANTTVSVSSNPGSISGLSAGTTYKFWVREVCGPNDKSDWIGPILGTTHCTAISAPWSEDFDSTTWTPGSGVYNVGDALAACWVRTPEKDTLPASPLSWGVRSGTTTTGQTGPSTDVSGTGNYIYTEASSGAPNQEAFIESPLLDLSGLLKPQVTFNYHMRGFYVNTLKLQVWVDSTQTWDTYFTKSGNQGNQWYYEEVDLAGFAGDTIVLRWLATKGNGSQGDIAVDEVVVNDQPLCPDPTQFALSGVTASTATFTWLTGGSTTWNIVYGAAGFSPSGGGLTNITSTTHTITGLTAGTTYDAYVRDTCGTLGASMWIGPITFNTLCAPFTAPYTENFDSTSWVTGANQTPGQIDGCWQRSDTVEYFWKAGPPTNHSNNTGPSGDHTSGSGGYIFTEANTGFGGGSTLTNSITSPLVDVTSLTTPELSFWYHMYGSLINKLEVYVRGAGGNWTLEHTISGAQQSNATAAWEEAIVDISNYANDTIQVKFTAYRYQGFSNQVDISVDDVDIHEAPTCPKPSNLAASNVTSNSVQLDWTTGGATNWLVKYAAGSIVSAGSNPFTLTGLSPNTTYDIYVRDSCGTGSVSDWVGPISITTLCGMVTAPWSEDFDGVSFDASTGDIDQCYTTSTSTTYFWQTGQGQTPTNNTGPNGDHTSGSGKYVYSESQFAFGGADSDAEFITAEIDLDTLSTPQVSFWWHGAGNNIDQLEVDVFSGGSWTTELTIDASGYTLQASPADAWQEGVVDLTSYVGDTIKLRFVAYRASTFGFNSLTGDWAIDDIEVDNAPTCLPPTVLATTANTTTSVTLSWTTGGASNWQVEYGPVGFTPGSGTIVAATTNPYTVTGLSAATYYDFYVRDSCGATDVSDWTGPITAATACGTATAPYFENFDNGFVGGTDNNQGHNIGATISPCWSRTDTDTNYRWGGRDGGTATFGTGPNGDHTSGYGNYVYTEASFSTGTPVATLTSPSIDLSALTTPEMHFWYHLFAQNGSQGTLTWSIQDVSVGTWVDLDSISGNQGNQWVEVIEDLSAYANKTVKIKFTSKKSSGATSQQGDIALDDLSIVEAPTCPDPSALSATSTAPTDVELSWTTGGATAWQIEYGQTGFVPGNGTIINVTTNPYTVTGLTSGVSYDFYLRDSCGATDFSDWIGPVTATTLTCVGGCTYDLELTDTFGDGWTGNNQGTVFHELKITAGTTVYSFTMSNTSGALGSSETFSFNVCDGDTLYVEFVDNGNWQSECGYVLTDPNGIVVSSVAGAANANQAGAMTAGVKYQGSANCSSPCPAPVAAFSSSDTYSSVDFDATASTGTGLTYDWDFGDGNTGSGDLATHLYAAGGTYVVDLTITDSCGQSVSLTDTILICEELIPAVIYSQNQFTVNFDASVIPGATSADWDFGDGTTGTGLTPSHTYGGSNTFAVDVTVYNDCGDQADTTLYITICVQPVANWTATIISAGGGGMQVQFNGTSSIGANSFQWNFGDGNTNTTSNYPLHTYATPSTAYVVTLKVFNACGDSDTKTGILGENLGVDDVDLGQWELYPNPALTQLTLERSIAIQGIITLTDGLGRTVLEQKGNGSNVQQIDVNELPAGSYVLRVIGDDGFYQQRIQIVK